MDMLDTRVIAAERSTVFAMLVSPKILEACIPGAEELKGSLEGGFDAVVVQRVGPIKAKFKGAVTIEDVIPDTSLRLVGGGNGGMAGFAKGAATVTLKDHAEGTELTYVLEAKIGGKIAQLGSRVIDGFVSKMADRFFERLSAVVESNSAAKTPIG